MSIKITTDSFEWPHRNRYGQPTENRVEVDVNTTITHDTVILNVDVLPSWGTFTRLESVELSMTHEEATLLSEALQKAIKS